MTPSWHRDWLRMRVRVRKGTWKLEGRDEARIHTGMIRQFGLELRFSGGGPRSARKKATKGRGKRK